jgi:hypothetical protein
MMNTASVFFDKVRVTGPCAYAPDEEDLFFKIDMDTGELAAISAAARQHSFFAHEGEIHVKFMGLKRDRIATRLRLEFCPPKLFQGHNLFGHCSLRSYVIQALALVVKKLGIKLSDQHAAAWRDGNVDLTEVHLTANFATEAQNVRPMIEAIATSAGPGVRWDSETSISLGFTPKRRSKYHVLTIYYKFEQLKAEFGKNVSGNRKRLLAEAKNSIRAEVKLYSQGLKRSGLTRAGSWVDGKAQEVFFNKLDQYKLHRAIQPQLTSHEVECLTAREVQVYRLWMGGMPLANQFASRASVKAYVDAIWQKVGVDVSGRYCMAKLPAVSLSDVFSPANLLPVPGWAIGTEFYAPPDGNPVRRRFARGISEAPLLLESENMVNQGTKRFARGIGDIPIDPSQL